jgi:hypothetical protein
MSSLAPRKQLQRMAADCAVMHQKATGGKSVARWSDWLPFPDPRKSDLLVAPFGAGVYELRNRKTNELVLRGMGANCAHRMSSLLPKPLGQGTRNNAAKRRYVLAHLRDVEYRYMACASAGEAMALERARKTEQPCLFNT